MPSLRYSGRKLSTGFWGGWVQDVRKFLNYKFTIMIVPHNAFKRFDFQLTFSFAFFLSVFSIGLFSWAGFAVVSNIDYWTMKVDHEILKLKVQYFTTEIRKSREVLEHVREADAQLRQLLGMGSRQAIVESDLTGRGKGGPEDLDRSILQKVLTQRLWEITDSEIRFESKAIQHESQDQIQSFKEISEYIAHERALSRSTPLGWPADGRITSRFGQRVSPMHGGPQFHMGVDVANERGTPIRATADGVVQLADWEGGYGRLVVVDHGFGYVTFYGHNSVLLVHAGQTVRRGQIIAQMGSTGSSTGDHSHYEIYREGRPVDPWRFMEAESSDDIRPGSRVRLARF